MGIGFELKRATGLAICRICKKKIAAGLGSIYITSRYEGVYQIHSNPLNCSLERMIELGVKRHSNIEDVDMINEL